MTDVAATRHPNRAIDAILITQARLNPFRAAIAGGTDMAERLQATILQFAFHFCVLCVKFRGLEAYGVWTFFHRLAQVRFSRNLEPVVGDPSAPGFHRCRGRNRDRDRFRLCIVVGPHARCSLSLPWFRQHRNDALQQGFTDRLPFRRSAPQTSFSCPCSHLLSFDSDSDSDFDTDSDPDPGPDSNPYRDRDAFVLY
jgi:hypothetical protein